MTAYESWQYRDPMLVLQRKQERAARSPKGKAAIARAGLEALFTGDSMGRKINLPDHILTAMHSWGDWAKRPQFWENLNSTPFYRLLPLPQASRPATEVRLDPLSHNIHRAVMRMECEKTKAVLYAYFVACSSWEDNQCIYLSYGISREYFDCLVKKGSLTAYNQVKGGK